MEIHPLFLLFLSQYFKNLQQGANMHQRDFDDLTPLDLVMLDSSEFIQYGAHLPCEVYVWGTNTNYTLGTGNHQSRYNPEPLDIFRRQGISIKQVYFELSVVTLTIFYFSYLINCLE